MATDLFTSLEYLLLLSTVLPMAMATPVHLPNWLSSAIPTKGFDDKTEIKCYSLPYGGVGFASHVLTYYTILLLYIGHRPLLPCGRLTHGILDLALGVTSIIVTVMLSSFTIYRCRNAWQFVLLAVWKLSMSLVLGCITINRAALVRKKHKKASVTTENENKRGQNSATGRAAENNQEREGNGKNEGKKEIEEGDVKGSWLFFYGFGLIIGLVGLVSLVKENWHVKNVRIVTFVIVGIGLGIAGIFAGIVAITSLLEKKESNAESQSAKPRSLASRLLIANLVGGFAIVGFFLGYAGIIGAFYCDWILAAIAGNYAGTPSSDVEWLYWTYFIAKRLPLASL